MSDTRRSDHDTTTGYEPVLIDGYVPVIDVGPAITGDPAARHAVGRALDDACRNSGFFLVSGHGVDAELIADMLDVTRRFFHVPLDDRRRLMCPPGDITLRGLRLFHEGRTARAPEAPARTQAPRAPAHRPISANCSQ